MEGMGHSCMATLKAKVLPESDIGLIFRANPDGSDDPLDVLRAIGLLRARLDEDTDGWVLMARQLCYTWATIGEALGMTRQSAHERWGRVAEFGNSDSASRPRPKSQAGKRTKVTAS
jgi:hypothetical protein